MSKTRCNICDFECISRKRKRAHELAHSRKTLNMEEISILIKFTFLNTEKQRIYNDREKAFNDRQRKKINMIEWLNENRSPNTNFTDLLQSKKNIIEKSDWDPDIIIGNWAGIISGILITTLQREEDNGDLPLECFDIHRNTIYIFDNKKWDKLTPSKFINLCEKYIYWPICIIFHNFLEKGGLRDGMENKVDMWTNKINKESSKRIRFYHRAMKDIFNHYKHNEAKIYEIDYE